MIEERKPPFRLEFNFFADYGHKIEASLAVSPEFELVGITDMRYSEDTVRAINLIFRKGEPHQLGRRVFTLKKEFEQLPTGEVTFDSQNSSKISSKKES